MLVYGIYTFRSFFAALLSAFCPSWYSDGNEIINFSVENFLQLPRGLKMIFSRLTEKTCFHFISRKLVSEISF